LVKLGRKFLTKREPILNPKKIKLRIIRSLAKKEAQPEFGTGNY